MTLRDTAEFQTKELGSPLSVDIKLLGNLLGKIIREQHGDEAFRLVEYVRQTAKARRSGDANAAATLSHVIENLDLDAKKVLTKAFSIYFQLINIAEDQQRIRVLRTREIEGKLNETIFEAIRVLHVAGLTAADVRELLDRINIRLVLTAHPSEAKRKAILVKLRQIAEMMTITDRQTLLPREQKAVQEALCEEIEQLWQTRPTRAIRATVADEVDFGLYFITSVIMDVVADAWADLGEALQTHYPDADWSELPALLNYASWIGGDRDGNPNVTADVTLDTLKTQRETARQVYLDELEFLREDMTQSIDEIPASPELLASIEDRYGLTTEHPGEIYRLKMKIIRAKLADDKYRAGEDLLAELLLIEDSLKRNHGQHAAMGNLRRLIQKVRLFGLHLIPLDIREDARLQAAALNEIFRYYKQADDYLNLPEEEKQALLTREVDNPRPFFPSELEHLSETTIRIITTWRMIAQAHRQYGKVVIDTVISSMSERPSDVLAMLLLASEVGIQNDVDLVPLFETIDDLKNAPSVMGTLFNNAAYRRHLEARGNRQQIMLGYSDSSKDGGYFASNWNLYIAQQQLAELCQAYGVALELFHGRGGSIGRGGGPTNRAILSQPPASMQGRIKITEQGEVIAYRYGNRDIARRHLHQVIHAVILAVGAPTNTEIYPEWREAMDVLSEEGKIGYRSLVYETVGFLDYWQQATPINELALMQISSRPAKRGAGGFAQMRAIPWVFSWMQSRAIIPSWYGVGYAIEQLCAQNPQGMAVLQEMYRNWSLFNALIENVQLDLAKADMGIAELYASLVADSALGREIFTRIQQEHKRACQMVCQIIGHEELLDNAPVLQNSIERRNPYVDPLNFIQVVLLRELRQLDKDTEEYEAVLAATLATVNGIAAGMKTTG